MRPIILNYHIFKNAGTSLDETLRSNFGPRWAPLETAQSSVRLSTAEVLDYAKNNPTIAAISSHSFGLPVLSDSGLRVISITFLRHPLERARSIWEFNRRRPDDVPRGAIAKRLGLAEYLELGLERGPGGDISVAGHQTRWLAPGGMGETLLERARETLAQFAVVGLVEEYPRSIDRLQLAAGPWFPGLRLRTVRANARREPIGRRLLRFVGRDDSLEDRLRALRNRIGPDLYRRLEDANQDDLILWHDTASSYQDVTRRLVPR